MSSNEETEMKARLRLIACLGTLVALVAGREDANAVQRAASSDVSTAVLYTDGWIIRFAQDDESDSHSARARGNGEGQDDS